MFLLPLSHFSGDRQCLEVKHPKNVQIANNRVKIFGTSPPFKVYGKGRGKSKRKNTACNVFCDDPDEGNKPKRVGPLIKLSYTKCCWSFDFFGQFANNDREGEDCKLANVHVQNA